MTAGARPARVTAFATLLLYLAVSGALLAPLPWQPTQRLVGSPLNVDWHGTWHAAWVVRQAGGDPRQLAHVDWLGFPAGQPFLAPTGMFVDLAGIATFQGLLGPAVGFNLAVWLLIGLLAFAAHRAARSLTGPGAAPLIAGGAVLLSHTLATEVSNGRFYQLAATALLLPFLAGLLGAAAGTPRRPALAGLALGLGVAAHWHTGQLFVGVGAICLAIGLLRGDAGDRRALLRWALICAGVGAAVAGPPALYMASRLASIPAVEGGFLDAAYPAAGWSVEVWKPTVDHSVPPATLATGGVLRWTLMLLALGSLAIRRDRAALGWWLLAGLALLVALGPLLTPTVEARDGASVYRGLPLPFSLAVRTVPFLWRLFWLDRSLLFVDVGTGVLAACAAAALARRLPRPTLAAGVVPAAVLAVLAVETATFGPLRLDTAPRWEVGDGEREVAAGWLASLAADPGGGAVLYYPPKSARVNSRAPGRWLYLQTLHERPMLNDVKGRRLDAVDPALREALADNTVLENLVRAPGDAAPRPDPRDVAVLVGMGFEQVIADPGALGLTGGELSDSALGQRLDATLGAPHRHGALLAWPLRVSASRPPPRPPAP